MVGRLRGGKYDGKNGKNRLALPPWRFRMPAG